MSSQNRCWFCAARVDAQGVPPAKLMAPTRQGLVTLVNPKSPGFDTMGLSALKGSSTCTSSQPPVASDASDGIGPEPLSNVALKAAASADAPAFCAGGPPNRAKGLSRAGRATR